MSHIKVINLERRPDRKEEVISLFNKHNVTNYEFVEAVDGKTLELTKDIFNLFQHNDFGNRKGVIGCALSHYNLWNKLLEDDIDYYYIMEDDIGFSDLYQDINIRLNEISNMIQTNLESIDFLFLGYHLWKDKQYKRNNLSDKIINIFNDNDYIGGFYSYIITKNGARKILEYIKTNGIRHGIDYLIKIIPNLQVYHMQPHFVLSDWVDTLNCNIDSDIQKSFDSFDFTSFQ